MDTWWKSPKEKQMEEEVAAWLASQPAKAAAPSPALAPIRMPALDVSDLVAKERAAKVAGTGGGGMPLAPAPTVPADVAAYVAKQAPAQDSDLLAAQGLAAQNRLFAGLGRAGTTATAALSHMKADTAPFDAMEAGADQPVKDLALQRSQAAEQRKVAEAAALKDKSSPQSKAFQARVAKTLPGVYSPEDLANLTAADQDQVLEYGKMRASLDQRKAEGAERERAAKAAEQSRTDTLQLHRDDLSERAKDRGLTREQMAQQNELNRQNRIDVARVGQHDKEAKDLEKDIQGAGKDLQDTSDTVAAVNYLAKVGRGEGDLPGMGVWDSRKPQILRSADDTAVDQRVKTVIGTLIHARTGATATPKEMDRIAGEYGLNGGTEDAARAGLARLAEDTKRALETRQARYRPEVLKEFKSRGGVTAGDVDVGTGTPAPTAVPGVKDPAAAQARIAQLKASGITDRAAIRAQLKKEQLIE